MNQTAKSLLGNQNANPSYWQYNSNEYRSFFNPGTASLSEFQAIGFGFNVPSDATILGVVINFGIISQSTTTGTVSEVALWYSGSQLGTLKSPGTPFTTTLQYVSYGSSGDLWSASLTPAIVNDPSFGYGIAAVADSVRLFLGFPFSCTVYYTLSGSGTVAIISSIVINNEVAPGLALVTTDEPHGLIPGIDVSIVGVEPEAVADVTAAEWSSGTTTLTTATSHNLNPGAVIQVNDATTSTMGTTFSFNGTFTVEKVPSPDQLVYFQSPVTATDPDVIDATASTGSVTVSWPIPDDTPTPTYFEVDSCPTPTTFYVAVTYSDGTWSTGTVGFIWEGTFYVSTVPSATTFTYFQPGPNGSTSAVGTVTPFGQMAPGLHLYQVLWLTDQGAISGPSPPGTFIANGGQYPSIANLPIGPSNVVARIIQWTGAQPEVPGELPPFFYIPTVPQLEGQIVGTSTVINDNVSTTAILDFSDDTLYAATGTSVLGNNLVNQIVLDGALNFSYWDSRLTTIGQRNLIQNFLNMGFEGGVNAMAPNSPLGWTDVGADHTYTLQQAHYGIVLQCNATTTGIVLEQPAYVDAYGDPIIEPNTQYGARAWLGNIGSGFDSLTFTLSSASTGYSSTAVLNVNPIAGTLAYLEANFSAKTPSLIPSDLMLSITVQVVGSGILQVDELGIFDALAPYLDNDG